MRILNALCSESFPTLLQTAKVESRSSVLQFLLGELVERSRVLANFFWYFRTSVEERWSRAKTEFLMNILLLFLKIPRWTAALVGCKVECLCIVC